MPAEVVQTVVAALSTLREEAEVQGQPGEHSLSS